MKHEKSYFFIRPTGSRANMILPIADYLIQKSIKENVNKKKIFFYLLLCIIINVVKFNKIFLSPTTGVNIETMMNLVCAIYASEIWKVG